MRTEFDITGEGDVLVARRTDRRWPGIYMDGDKALWLAKVLRHIASSPKNYDGVLLAIADDLDKCRVGGDPGDR